jgi:cytochrome c-type biogenesis protein CcmH/NrfF
VPAPQTVVPGTTLRWAAPAAALIVASAILVGRALRRRR